MTNGEIGSPDGEEQAVRTKLRFLNPSDEPVELWLEPWGDLVRLESGVEVELEIDAPAEAPSPGVVVERGRLAIHLGSGATVRALVAGQPIGGCDIPAP